MESPDGQSVDSEFQIKAMKDFTPKELIENNDQLSTSYYSKEILADLDKQLKKNNPLKKTISDKEKKEALLKAAKYYIDLLSE
jgi:predicted component of type VI protein secretion system